MRMESRVGQGSTFFMTMPLKRVFSLATKEVNPNPDSSISLPTFPSGASEEAGLHGSMETTHSKRPLNSNSNPKTQHSNPIDIVSSAASQGGSSNLHPTSLNHAIFNLTLSLDIAQPQTTALGRRQDNVEKAKQHGELRLPRIIKQIKK